MSEPNSFYGENPLPSLRPPTNNPTGSDNYEFTMTNNPMIPKSIDLSKSQGERKGKLKVPKEAIHHLSFDNKNGIIVISRNPESKGGRTKRRYKTKNRRRKTFRFNN